MYGKFFASTFTGSMFGAGPDVFAVWGYVIANTIDATIELNPQFLAAVIGMSEDRVQKAIVLLTSPDPRSRSQHEQGRRLVHESAYQYKVVNHAQYRALRNEEDRRAYNREAKRKERAVKRVVNDNTRLSNMSAYTEAEAETKTEAEKIKTLPRAARSATVDSSDFGVFWSYYPRHVGKSDALKAWSKLSPKLETVLAALKWQSQQPGWVKDGGQFVPHPATWLNRKGWEDEPFHIPSQQEPTEVDSSAPVAESWVVECRRLHARACGHRAAHAVRMERDHAV